MKKIKKQSSDIDKLKTSVKAVTQYFDKIIKQIGQQLNTVIQYLDKNVNPKIASFEQVERLVKEFNDSWSSKVGREDFNSLHKLLEELQSKITELEQKNSK